jgi:D-hydroxyproline dehydrogenase subunit beta
VRTEIVVIGGGIIGCAAAAILADRGARVTLVERAVIGAGASGRNLGAIQHPFDPTLAALHHDSLTRYRALSDAGDYGFALADGPVGLLLLNRDADAARAQAARMADAVPELRPRLLTADDVASAEPSLQPGPAAVRLETGYPIPPASATQAWATLAEERGAHLLIDTEARPVVESGAVAGARLADGHDLPADAVLVAAGPWTGALIDGGPAWDRIRPTWGVTVQLDLGADAPRHIVEEDEVDTINRADAATERAMRDPEDDPTSLFSMASADGVSTLGSTFLSAEPDPERIAALLLRRAADWLPAVEGAGVLERRMCVRPQSVDGRPFIGQVEGVEGLFVCAGHGPWGISTGPGSAAMVARAILDGTAPPAALAATRAV